MLTIDQRLTSHLRRIDALNLFELIPGVTEQIKDVFDWNVHGISRNLVFLSIVNRRRTAAAALSLSSNQYSSSSG
jgi:hypothetical protein